MTIDIEALILEIDEDGSGEIEFDEFKALLTGEAWNSFRYYDRTLLMTQEDFQQFTDVVVKYYKNHKGLYR